MLRRAVLVSGSLFVLAGFTMLLHLSLPLLLRLLLIGVWLADGMRLIARQARGQSGVRAIRLTSASACEIQDQDGKIVPCALLAGSVLTTGFCWLRFARPGCASHGEWLSTRVAPREAWRQLQIARRWGPDSSD